MRILVSGSTGMIGTALVAALRSAGHQVVRLVRAPFPGEDDTVGWNPATGSLNREEVEGFDAAFHLAGASIDRRWTRARKMRILQSRQQGTRLLAERLAQTDRPPRVLISASAMGYYGDRGEEVLREDSDPGTGFLAETCLAWETAAEVAARSGIRVVNPRFSLVLSAKGGALRRMLLPFRLGVGGPIGSGRQYWSWVHIDDLIGALLHVMMNHEVRGAVNVASLRPVTNREFARTLGRVLHRPALFPLPAWVARLVLGEMAGPLLLASARLDPVRLRASGYHFKFTELEAALRDLLR